jgi:hypothetical protein
MVNPRNLIGARGHRLPTGSEAQRHQAFEVAVAPGHRQDQAHRGAGDEEPAEPEAPCQYRGLEKPWF